MYKTMEAGQFYLFLFFFFPCILDGDGFDTTVSDLGSEDAALETISCSMLEPIAFSIFCMWWKEMAKNTGYIVVKMMKN